MLRVILPIAAFAAYAERVRAWWEEWIWVWAAMLSPEEQRRWRGEQRDHLDADTINHGWHGGFAAGSGGDEG